MSYVAAHDEPEPGALPRVFTPAEAAKVLRHLGLTEITECALRTRAYRKQVPFHLNGRRITFTVSDLREIAEGQACMPQPRTAAIRPPAAAQLAPRRRPPHRAVAHRGDRTENDLWRARTSRQHRSSESTAARATTGAPS